MMRFLASQVSFAPLKSSLRAVAFRRSDSVPPMIPVSLGYFARFSPTMPQTGKRPHGEVGNQPLRRSNIDAAACQHLAACESCADFDQQPWFAEVASAFCSGHGSAERSNFEKRDSFLGRGVGRTAAAALRMTQNQRFHCPNRRCRSLDY